MKCPSCGKENPAGEQFCLDCGSDLSATPAAAPAAGQAAAPAATGAGALSDEEFQRLLNTPPVKTCPHCGAPAPASGNYCDSCGEPLTGASAAATTTATAMSADPSATPAPASMAAPTSSSTPADTQSPTASIDTPPETAPPSPPAPAGVRFDLAGPSSTSGYSLSSDEVHIGRRDAEAGIYPEIDFDGNDIVVDGGEKVHAVSRRHGRIFRDAAGLHFEDSGSTNGSTLNGTPVLANDPQTLKDGDLIVLGRTCRITVHLP